MNQKSKMKFFALIVSALFVFSPVITAQENRILEEADIWIGDVEDKTLVDETDLPELLSLEQAREAGHIERLYCDEHDLNTAIFRNNDGTSTAYIFSEDIKYVDKDGKIKDKSNRLYAEGEYVVNRDNDISLLLPLDIKEGIRMLSDSVELTMTPKSNYPNTAERVSLNLSQTRTIEDTVVYSNVFGDGTSIKYTPTFSGLKEDIVLESYVGQNEFSFLINTYGSELVLNNGRLLVCVDGKDTGFFSPVIIYDNEGTLTEGHYVLETIKADWEYIVTVVVDVEFLTSENTKYPVTIDPTITIYGTGTGANKEILDATLYQSMNLSGTGTIDVNNVGFVVNANYGWARSIFRFPKLFDNITFSMLPSERITSVVLRLWATARTGTGATAIVFAYQYDGLKNWAEASITSGANPAYLTSNGSTTTITTSGKSYDLSITNIVKELWKKDTQLPNSPEKAYNKSGVILVNGNETNINNGVRFAATENAVTSQKPVLIYTYTETTSFAIINRYSNRFNSNVSGQVNKISAANTFINKVFSGLGVSFSHSTNNITNVKMISDDCTTGRDGECNVATTICGANCFAAHHRNIERYANVIYNGPRVQNNIYITWDWISRNSICYRTDATHKLSSYMAGVTAMPNTRTRGILVPSGYWDGKPVINIFEPTLSFNTTYLDSTMKLMAAHEMAHVMGMHDNTAADHGVSHTTWVCIMRQFNYSQQGDAFVKEIEAGRAQPFCTTCKSRLSNVVKVRHFPAN